MNATLQVGSTAIWEPLGALDPDCGPAAAAIAAAAPLPAWPVGLERALLARGAPRLDLAALAMGGAAGGPRFEDSGEIGHLLRRPPGELAAWRLWRLLERGPLRREDIAALSRLLGGPAALRTKPLATTPLASGERSSYLPPERIPERLDRLLARLADPHPGLPPLLHATGIYFETLCIHPLPDGNGRLARLLFLGALRQTLGLAAPLVPLGPAIALHRAHVLGCYFAWYLDRDPRPLVDFVLAAVAATLEAAGTLIADDNRNG